MRSTAAVLDHQLTLASVSHGRVEEAACAVAGEALDWTPRAAEVIRLAVENCPMHTAAFVFIVACSCGCVWHFAAIAVLITPFSEYNEVSRVRFASKRRYPPAGQRRSGVVRRPIPRLKENDRRHRKRKVLSH